MSASGRARAVDAAKKLDILAAIRTGEKYKIIAARFGVSEKMVGRISAKYGAGKQSKIAALSERIMVERDSGASRKELVMKYGVSIRTIARIEAGA